MDYRDATALYANPAKPIRFPVYPHPHEVEATSSKRSLTIPRRTAFKVSVPVLEGILRVSDIVLLFAAVVVAYGLHAIDVHSFHAPFDSPATRNQDILTGVIATGVTALCLHWARGYALGALRSAGAQIRAVGMSLGAGLATMFGFLLLLQANHFVERTWALEWLVSAASLLGLSRLVLAWVMRRWERAGCFTRSIAVIGDSNLGHSLIARATHAGSDYRAVGFYEDLTAIGASSNGADTKTPAVTSPVGTSTAVTGRIDELIARCRQERIDAILIAVPLSDRQRIADITRQLSVTVSDIYVATDIAEICSAPSHIVHIAKETAVLVKQRPLKDWEALQKRAFDVVLASVLLFFLAPFMALIALLIKLDSPGPVLFLQPRFGFNNNLFSVYKFRSMHDDMADMLADQQTKKNDKRITRVGKWLRKLSFDELPQLYNVILGDMSLVGPRPHAPNTKAGGLRFTEIMAEEYALRHRVRPGITGWAQVNGWRGETQTVEQLEKRVACDLHYIENWSLFFDVKILLLTLRRGIASPQAY